MTKPQIPTPVSSVATSHSGRHEGLCYYRHQRLPSINHFRLLRLAAGRGKEDVSSTLIAFEIDHPHRPSYRAISYTWGSGEPDRNILVQGEMLKVTRNLLEILRYVRHAQHDCYVWIDALCIDQKSDAERNHQVKLMGKIYKNANMVVAWLLSNDDPKHQSKDMEAAFMFIVKATSHFTGGNSVQRYLAEDGSEYPWNSLATFCRARYWTRKWIIQEVVAAHNLILQARHAECPMTVVEDFFEQLNQNPYNTGPIDGVDKYTKRHFGDFNQKANLHTTPAALLVLHRRQNRIAKDSLHSLRQLLPRYEGSECKEPCDHVYSLYSLLGKHRKHLEVDYARDPIVRCKTVLQFMWDHEGLSALDTISCTGPLVNKLGIFRQLNVRDALDRSTSIVTPPKVTFFDRGRADLVDESHTSLLFRKSVAALRSMHIWYLRRGKSHWEVQSNAKHSRDIGVDVNPYDLTCFRIPGTKTGGLATNRIQVRDRVWQFQQTNNAFIVRVGAGNDVAIVGRALLFYDDAAGVKLDRLIPEPHGPPIETKPVAKWKFMAKSKPLANTTSAQMPSLSGEVSGLSDDILLSWRDLLELAYWADSTGTADNPFVAEDTSSGNKHLAHRTWQ